MDEWQLPSGRPMSPSAPLRVGDDGRARGGWSQLSVARAMTLPGGDIVRRMARGPATGMRATHMGRVQRDGTAPDRVQRVAIRSLVDGVLAAVTSDALVDRAVMCSCERRCLHHRMARAIVIVA